MTIKPQALMGCTEGHLRSTSQGKYGPIYPRTPACYGFSLVAKIKPGREDAFYEHGKRMEAAVTKTPDCLAVLKLHFLRWLLFPINGSTYFMYQGIFDTDFDKYRGCRCNLRVNGPYHGVRESRRVPGRLGDKP